MLKEGPQIYEGIKVILSASGIQGKTEVFPCQQITENQQEIPQLNLEIEEFDFRMMPHAMHSAADGMSTIIIMSNDTDILVPALYFSSQIQTDGATAIYMRGRIGDSI